MSFPHLRATDPGCWREPATAWRVWAATAGRWAAELRAHAARLRTIWRGSAADAAAALLATLIRRLTLFRLGCWAADQALSEFAAALARGRSMPANIPAGVAVTADGTVSGRPAEAVRATAATITAALTIAAEADSAAASRLSEVDFGGPVRPPTVDPPACTATPAQVRRWWEALDPAQRRWLLATRPEGLGPLDGVPAAVRDLANRLALDDLPARLPGLAALRDRLADGAGPRAYLLRIDPAGEGRAVVAVGDPDRAANVLTQVPGMTADLASYGGELARAERIATRAHQLAPEAATSTIMWLGYDAPDFVPEAASRAQATAGAIGLRGFQDGLRATHLGPPAHQTVLGHSYGSLVVGAAAARAGLATDEVVFVGSPGVGVDSAAELHAPPGHVWSSTSRSDVIQWAAVSPRSLAGDLLLSQAVPGGALLAFTRPENDLFFGANPSDPAFGARVFASEPDAGHLGYWEPGSAALDALAAIAVGRGDVIPR
ncbi:alpha/beta hydrolase [Actinoplanes nipponensis]|uniref:alpha/beta hydrolase n=1 Tax=Actinoplanes nipponensis TaxID=135950 RepID=UPI001EF1D69D|nr:alpha/beta hydrolase [Actinoplanes nipponensis]